VTPGDGQRVVSRPARMARLSPLLVRGGARCDPPSPDGGRARHPIVGGLLAPRRTSAATTARHDARGETRPAARRLVSPRSTRVTSSSERVERRHGDGFQGEIATRVGPDRAVGRAGLAVGGALRARPGCPAGRRLAHDRLHGAVPDGAVPALRRRRGRLLDHRRRGRPAPGLPEQLHRAHPRPRPPGDRGGGDAPPRPGRIVPDADAGGDRPRRAPLRPSALGRAWALHQLGQRGGDDRGQGRTSAACRPRWATPSWKASSRPSPRFWRWRTPRSTQHRDRHPTRVRGATEGTHGRSVSDRNTCCAALRAAVPA
jgi:hypothetical protein